MIKKILSIILILSALTGFVSCACSHEFTSEISVEPTCAEGIKVFTCQKCKEKYTESIPPIKEHNYKSEITTKPSGYLTKGVKTYTCTVCGNSYNEYFYRVSDDQILQDFMKCNYENELSPIRVSELISGCMDGYEKVLICQGNEFVKDFGVSQDDLDDMIDYFNKEYGVTNFTADNLYYIKITGPVKRKLIPANIDVWIASILIYDNDNNFLGCGNIEASENLKLAAINYIMEIYN